LRIRFRYPRCRKFGLFVTEFCEVWIGLGDPVDGPLWLSVSDEYDVHHGSVTMW
jgi:hypothetical protein